jgi:hypothetical protein
LRGIRRYKGDDDWYGDQNYDHREAAAACWRETWSRSLWGRKWAGRSGWAQDCVFLALISNCTGLDLSWGLFIPPFRVAVAAEEPAGSLLPGADGTARVRELSRAASTDVVETGWAARSG